MPHLLPLPIRFIRDADGRTGKSTALTTAIAFCMAPKALHDHNRLLLSLDETPRRESIYLGSLGTLRVIP